MLKRPYLINHPQINQFEEKKKIGQGGFGKVSLVQDKTTKEIYALKTITNIDENDEKPFREVEIMMKISHPTIIKLNRYFFENKNLYILMEYSINSSLNKVIERVQSGLINGILYSDTIRQIFLAGISKGMKYLHDRNIVHRDLKLGNVLIDEHYHPHISDFGLSKIFEKGHTLTQSDVDGTLLYMAPEIFISNNFDARKSDVFSFGIMMYEIITDSFIDREMYRAINTQNFSIFNTKKIKNSLKNLIIKCLSKDPNERPTFRELFYKFSAVENEDYILDNVDMNDFFIYVNNDE